MNKLFGRIIKGLKRGVLGQLKDIQVPYIIWPYC